MAEKKLESTELQKKSQEDPNPKSLALTAQATTIQKSRKGGNNNENPN